MHTTGLVLHPETRTISIEAPRHAVLHFLGDANNLPRWAPNFARTVHPKDGRWLINAGPGEAEILVETSEAEGTVDILAAADPTRGAFCRVLPNGDGSEFLFTLFLQRGASDSAIGQQMSVVEEELRAVRNICERAFATPDAT